MCWAHLWKAQNFGLHRELSTFLLTGTGAAGTACPALSQDTLPWHPPAASKAVLQLCSPECCRKDGELHHFIWLTAESCLTQSGWICYSGYMWICIDLSDRFQLLMPSCKIKCTGKILFCFCVSLNSPLFILDLLLWLSWPNYFLKCFLFY